VKQNLQWSCLALRLGLADLDVLHVKIRAGTLAVGDDMKPKKTKQVRQQDYTAMGEWADKTM